MSQKPTASQSHEPWPDAGGQNPIHGPVNVGCDGRIIDSQYTDLVVPNSNTNVWWTAQFSSM